MQFAWLLTFLSAALVPLAKKLLAALGIGAVTYIGMNAIVDQAKQHVMTSLQGMPADVVQLIGLTRMDVAVNIIFAAIATRMTLAGVNKLSGGSKSGLGNVGAK